MEKHRPRQEFAPGITDQDCFIKLVNESEYAKAGGPNNEEVRAEMKIRLDQINSLLNLRAYIIPIDKRTKRIRNGFLTEKAIIIELFIINDLLT
jgi:hypothetical protein